ncbi:aromatic ring-hydroxylating oxygenase subunit alpha [Ruegeria marina]|uniref:Rieske 2Fe-2S family protein n=1 Tax=Ruegeria marina TaxID=639004 RepID=A0A1G7CU80_9RHOB|nr:aromatic ring-hydroxylating dioxygenase subunit alpha [Ruegeria marina]SDE42868.1 Rieske 2Fe-2S family protein [Ruegeria marina]
MTGKPTLHPTPWQDEISELIAGYKRGYALAQPFYTSEAVFQRDVDRVFLKEWHLVGHVSELPEPGDYLLFELLGESVIVVRNREGAFHALANVCRHRGSRVCLEPRGNVSRFSCPYHAWVYNLDGSLFSARLMGADTDKNSLGLKRFAIEVFHGLIYVCFSDRPEDFSTARTMLEPMVAPFGLVRTRIAARTSYPVAANWKLLVENYNECYHCTAAHPEFSRSHVIHLPERLYEPLNAKVGARAAGTGAPADRLDATGPNKPKGAIDIYYRRYALFDGYETGSEDGKPLAPLLGDLSGWDSAASDIYVGILNPMLVYSDHAVIYRFIPVDKDNSIQEIIWLVHEDAVEGRDYDKDRLTWLWDVTTESDKLIIEKNQEGVNSRFYEPGPFSPMESHTRWFVESYLRTIA